MWPLYRLKSPKLPAPGGQRNTQSHTHTHKAKCVILWFCSNSSEVFFPSYNDQCDCCFPAYCDKKDFKKYINTPFILFFIFLPFYAQRLKLEYHLYASQNFSIWVQVIWFFLKRQQRCYQWCWVKSTVLGFNWKQIFLPVLRTWTGSHTGNYLHFGSRLASKRQTHQVLSRNLSIWPQQ